RHRRRCGTPLFSCTFATQCCQVLNIQWNHSLSIKDRILHANTTSGLPYFIEVCVLAMWELWKMRNRKIFEGHTASVNLWVVRFKEQVRLQSVRIKEAHRPAVLSWINSL
ncbi:hypothetical protein BS78_K021700, partial [Paspalum vaginatum]